MATAHVAIEVGMEMINAAPGRDLCGRACSALAQARDKDPDLSAIVILAATRAAANNPSLLNRVIGRLATVIEG